MSRARSLSLSPPFSLSRSCFQSMIHFQIPLKRSVLSVKATERERERKEKKSSKKRESHSSLQASVQLIVRTIFSTAVSMPLSLL